jgi:hypothetical protein
LELPPYRGIAPVQQNQRFSGRAEAVIVGVWAAAARMDRTKMVPTIKLRIVLLLEVIVISSAYMSNKRNPNRQIRVFF